MAQILDACFEMRVVKGWGMSFYEYDNDMHFKGAKYNYRVKITTKNETRDSAVYTKAT
jgi:hypothetical protein